MDASASKACVVFWVAFLDTFIGPVAREAAAAEAYLQGAAGVAGSG